MLSKRFGNSVYQNLHFAGYIALAIGLPTNKVVLSIASLWILLLVLLEGKYKLYLERIRNQQVIFPLIALLFLQVISFCWSHDLNYALKDFNTKLPLYSIPIVMLVEPLQAPIKRIRTLQIFVCTMFITSFYNFGSFIHLWGNHIYDDIRGMSLLISHIRYALMITMAAACSLYWLKTDSTKRKWIWFVLLGWFIFYTYYAQILSGVMTLIGVLIVWIILEIKARKNKWFTRITIGFGILVSIGISVGLYFFFQPQKMKISLKNLPWVTQEGNRYYYQWNQLELENGYPIYYFWCQEEMEKEWNKRSKINYDSLDLKGQRIEATIIRYVTSKGMYKDGAAIRKLSSQDIQNIEQGIPTIVGTQGGFMERLAGLKNEFVDNQNPNGQSISQRFLYWKTGLKILQKNWLIGVGAGDVDLAFQMQYVKDHSQLIPENRLRTHNQYITYAISFGIAGICVFIWLLFRFWRCNWKQNHQLALYFVVIAALSFLVEDTLETQMGVTFFAFFYGFFLSETYGTKKA
jgi:hypothetical protein